MLIMILIFKTEILFVYNPRTRKFRLNKNKKYEK